MRRLAPRFVAGAAVELLPLLFAAANLLSPVWTIVLLLPVGLAPVVPAARSGLAPALAVAAVVAAAAFFVGFAASMGMFAWE